MGRAYEVLSIRAGDKFMGKQEGVISDALKKCLFSLIKNKTIPCSKFLIVVTSDSYNLKHELAGRYNFIMFPHAFQHGACGNAVSVAMDMNLRKHSKFNHTLTSGNRSDPVFLITRL